VPDTSPSLPVNDLSVRVDPVAGLRERAEFFGPDAALFGITHEPLSPPRGGLLICQPLHAEVLRNYRREVFLGRTLAAAGYVVLRFHYRGAGHSAGATTDLTFETMRDDAMVAAEHLAARTPAMAVLGTRLGGLVAAAVGNKLGAAPVALWEPVAKPSRWFREVLRARRIGQLKQVEGPAPVAGSLMHEMEERGQIDVLGYPVAWNLHQSIAGLDLTETLGDAARHVLVVEMSRATRLRREYADLAAGWQAAGCDVETHALGYQEAWWFAGTKREVGDIEDASARLVDLTSGWVQASLAAPRSS
jgi:hypothetical protein